MGSPTASVLDRVELRPVVAGDLEDLVDLYAAGRAAELDQVAWPPGQREAFVRMQHDAQDRHYRAANPDATFDVVEVEGRFAGRITLDRRVDDIRVVDLALLPPYRGRGIGGALLTRVLAEASATGRTASIHVEVHNPARRLYARLGFRPVEDRGVYLLMRWTASGEGGLVAPGADRDQEERGLADLVVAHLPGPLGQSLGTAEDQRELLSDAPVGRGGTGLGTERRLVEGQRDPLAAGQADVEPVADEPGEVVMGEPLHPPTVAGHDAPSRRS
ncbi:GNAT family N-acetyltransferase [Nocardioides sp. LML1-1-1.1]